MLDAKQLQAEGSGPEYAKDHTLAAAATPNTDNTLCYLQRSVSCAGFTPRLAVIDHETQHKLERTRQRHLDLGQYQLVKSIE